MKHKKRNKNIIIVTGGTGGHIYPAITIGQYFIERYLNVNFITDKRGFLNSNLAKFKPKLINKGLRNVFGSLGDYLGDSDIAQVRYFDKPVQMWEMLGFHTDFI